MLMSHNDPIMLKLAVVRMDLIIFKKNEMKQYRINRSQLLYEMNSEVVEWFLSFYLSLPFMMLVLFKWP